ncbi:MAG: CotH kinase family protein, partial [Phycisphaerae bacterium]
MSNRLPSVSPDVAGPRFEPMEPRLLLDAGPVVINEIMYHPAGVPEPLGEEFVELYNAGPDPVNLNGWRLNRGVDYTFGDMTLGAGETLVVAGDTAAFQAAHPDFTGTVVGGWEGHLSNSGEDVELENALGDRIDLVSYADQGDWAHREYSRGVERVESLTVDGTEATARIVDHGVFFVDDPDATVEIFGANEPEYNGVFDVTDATAYSISFDLGVEPAGPATGTILCRQLTDEDHTGWSWVSMADGLGRSVELINGAFSNETGQNWAASLADGGTPGAANSVAAADIAPVIRDVSHGPAVPGTADPVTVTCEVVDDHGAPLTVTLHTRVDTEETDFTPHAMFDDGQHGDGPAGDGVYGATVGPFATEGTIVEFYVEASDGTHARTWPAPARLPGDPVTYGQAANALFQVDNGYVAPTEWTPGRMPIYRLIMRDAERDELIQDICGTGDHESNAQMNGTFISVDGVDVRVRYQVGIRNRGAGSRTSSPYNHRVNFPHDTPWKGVTNLNLNHRYSWVQVIGSSLWQAAGLAAADATGVEVRVNGVDRAETGSEMYGAYAAVEVLDDDFADHWWPDDSAGDLWRCSDNDIPGQQADLDWEGANPDAYRDTYDKQTNAGADDWSGLLDLCHTLINAPDETFLDEVSQRIDLDQWLRHIAVDALAGNLEGGLTSGRGDDFAMYQGVADPRFLLVPHDLDTLFGQGDHSPDPDRSIFVYDGVDGLDRLLHHPDVVARYYAQYLDLIETVFAPEAFEALLDRTVGGWVPESVIQEMEDYLDDRIHGTGGVLDQIPRDGLTVDSSLAEQDGYPRTTDDDFQVDGTADGTTRSITVNGELAEWNPRSGTWTFDSTDFDSGYTEEMLVAGDAGVAYHVPTPGDDPAAWTDPLYDDSGWATTISEGTAGLLVTEIRTGGGTSFVELQNVSDAAIDTDGWSVVVNDPRLGSASDVPAGGQDVAR